MNLFLPVSILEFHYFEKNSSKLWSLRYLCKQRFVPINQHLHFSVGEYVLDVRLLYNGQEYQVPLFGFEYSYILFSTFLNRVLVTSFSIKVSEEDQLVSN